QLLGEDPPVHGHPGRSDRRARTTPAGAAGGGEERRGRGRAAEEGPGPAGEPSRDLPGGGAAQGVGGPASLLRRGAADRRPPQGRSEERRVGKECRTWGSSEKGGRAGGTVAWGTSHE